MEKFNWYDYIQLSKIRKNDFLGITVDEKNIVYAYVPGEEKKFKAALKKQEKLLKL